MSFPFFYLWSLLLTIVACAAGSDIVTHKIPNELIVLGLICGFWMGFTNWSQFGWKWLGIFVVFGLGSMGLMGLGDIKLWMVLVAFLGFKRTLLPIGGAAILFIVYVILKDRTEFTRIFKEMGKQTIIRQYQLIPNQQSYPFAPFIFLGTIGEMVEQICQ